MSFYHLTISAIFLTVTVGTTDADGTEPFAIQVVDEDTGRGVPLVELKTVNNVRFFTDSAGFVAIREPELMDQPIFFHVKSHGYEFAKDGFGFRGTRIMITAGGHATLKIKRINIAQRLYRVTGAGIYRDSVLLSKQVPVKQPLLNGKVFGSDSVVNAIFNGKLYWFWGDTNRPSYPLGNFHVPGATSNLPSNDGLNPEVGVDLEYFVNKQGFVKPTAKLPGKGPTWINGLIVVNGDAGERLLASYVKIKPPLTVYERGLIEFDGAQKEFKFVAKFDMEAPVFPHGHPFLHVDGDKTYVYYGDPFPLIRVPAEVAKMVDLSEYEVYTCVKPGSRAGSIEIERQNGKPVYRWIKDTVPYTPSLQAKLIKNGKLKSKEGLFRFRDQNGKPVTIHRGSVCWNEYRKRWIMIAGQNFGTSLLGEIWYAESESLVGPWLNAVKIVTHDRCSFYNPKQHPYFDKDGGRTIFFEGTYTTTFSGNPDKTPRYDYNQIMYKLDLDDPRLKSAR